MTDAQTFAGCAFLFGRRLLPEWQALALRVIEMRTRRLSYAILPLVRKNHLSCRVFLEGKAVLHDSWLLRVLFFSMSPSTRSASAA